MVVVPRKKPWTVRSLFLAVSYCSAAFLLRPLKGGVRDQRRPWLQACLPESLLYFVHSGPAGWHLRSHKAAALWSAAHFVFIPQTVLALGGSYLFCKQLALASAPKIRWCTHVWHALLIKPMLC